MMQSFDDALRAACEAVGIVPPRRHPVPGRWTRTNTTERNGKDDASVLVFDGGEGGIAWNWQTGVSQRFSIRQPGEKSAPRPRDPDKERREAQERAAVEATCARIVKACGQETHPYLARKGFPGALGLVLDDPRPHLPEGWLGEAMAKAMPQGGGPLLVIPGRIGGKLTTVQFINAEGGKKNLFRGNMSRAVHRIATGPRTVVCEGIATAMSVDAALRLLNVRATVLCAFAANNVGKVAEETPGSFICADHDKPVETFAGLGTGEFYARRSGRPWTMPPSPGDFNDFHQREGLRAVALHLKEALAG